MPGFVPTFYNLKSILVMVVDIIIMWWVYYYALRIARNNTRTITLFKGIILVIIVDGIAKVLGLKTVQFIMDIFMNWGFLVILIIFQPEIRTILEKIGKSSVFSKITTLTGNEKVDLVDKIVTAVTLLSKDQTGALISIEQNQSLDDFIATGTKLESDVTAELLTSLFVTTTPLHDGAVIIQGDKIACAGAYFPPTNRQLPSRYGARHRAAIGISEVTDAVTIIVSEESGNISITENGRIYSANRKQLRDYLLKTICGQEIPISSRPIDVTPAEPKELNTKIATEEVVPAKEKSVFSSLFGNDEIERNDITSEDKLREIDEDANAIKMPHHKNVNTPSYPENHFESSDEKGGDNK